MGFKADILVGFILDDDSVQRNRKHLNDIKKDFKMGLVDSSVDESTLDKVYSIVGLVGFDFKSMSLVDLPLTSKNHITYGGSGTTKYRYFIEHESKSYLCLSTEFGWEFSDYALRYDRHSIVIKYRKSGEYRYLGGSILDIPIISDISDLSLTLSTLKIPFGHSVLLEVNFLEPSISLVKDSDISGKGLHFITHIYIQDVVSRLSSMFDSSSGVHRYNDIVYIDSGSDTVVIPKECNTIFIGSSSVETFALPEEVDSIRHTCNSRHIKNIMISKNTGCRSLCNIIYWILLGCVDVEELKDAMKSFNWNADYDGCIEYLRKSSIFSKVMRDIQVTVY